MDTSNIATIAISLIAALASIATNRAANKASTRNTEIESRTTIEADAYNRARKFDTDTIERQDDELKALRAENVELRKRIEVLELELHPNPPEENTNG